jgi:uncharacterized protein DUF6332
VRTQEERDEQTVDIMTGVFGAALLVVAVVTLIAMFHLLLPQSGATLLVGAGLVAAGLLRRWRRR